jgi:putative ABC transport system permease protein
MIRSSISSLFRASGFTVTAVLTLALGIGLSTAVFTVADALLLRRLPVRDQDQLVSLVAEKRDKTTATWPLPIADADAFVHDARTIQEAAYVDFYSPFPTSVLNGDHVFRLRRALVSGQFFDVLGTQAALGRTLGPADDRVGSAPVLVLSDNAWRQEFGGDPLIVGKRVTLQENGVAYIVEGVMPAGLEYPAGTDFWAPYTPARLQSANDSSFAVVTLVGRLARRSTPAATAGELTGFLHRPSAAAFENNLLGVSTPLPRVILGDARPAVLVFGLAAGLLLLIACLDVANLLLVRGLNRVSEFAVRSALGASRARLVEQLLLESLVLALAGGALGVAVAAVALHTFLALAPASVSLLGTIRLDATSIAAAIGITSAAVLLFGLGPALVTSRANLQDLLRSASRHTVDRGARLTREALVGAQVVLAVLVLSAATVLGRSFLRLQDVDLGFEPSHLLIAELGLRYDQYGDAQKQATLMRVLVSRLQVTPGVRAVSPVVAVPFSGTAGWDGIAAIEGQSAADVVKNPVFNMEVVTPEYFETFGLHATRGRLLTDDDRQGSEPAIVVSKTMARRYWPGLDPIGRRVLVGPALDHALTVVGVVPDTRYRDLREARATVYFPLAQPFFPFTPTTLAIRSSGSDAALVSALREAIRETAPGVVLASASPFASYLGRPLAEPRLNAFLLAVFALSALALAAIGLFSVMATLVRQRTRELGIRIALGATARDIRSLVLGRGVAIVGAGLVVGVVGSMVTNRLLASLLYDVKPTDMLSLGLVGSVMLAVALVASLVPARAGSRIDPVIAMRTE